MFQADVAALPDDIAAGVTPKRSQAARGHWKIWCDWCEGLGHDPGLSQWRDPVPVLQVFMRQFKDGRLAPGGNPVVARHAEDAVRSVGQAFASLGVGDPRIDQRTGRTDFRIARQQAGYRKTDAPPKLKLPISRDVLVEAHRLADLSRRRKTLLSGT